MLANPPNGFTLVETLIAAVIAFFAITTLSLVFNSAFQTQTQVEKRMSILQQVPMAVEDIKLRITSSSQSEALSGRGFLDRAEYQWQAQVVKTAFPPNIIDFESGSSRTSDGEFYLWLVNLEVTSGAWLKEYQFNVVSWK